MTQHITRKATVDTSDEDVGTTARLIDKNKVSGSSEISNLSEDSDKDGGSLVESIDRILVRKVEDERKGKEKAGAIRLVLPKFSSVRFLPNYWKPRVELEVQSRKSVNLGLDYQFRFKTIWFRFNTGSNLNQTYKFEKSVQKRYTVHY